MRNVVGRLLVTALYTVENTSLRCSKLCKQRAYCCLVDLTNPGYYTKSRVGEPPSRNTCGETDLVCEHTEVTVSTNAARVPYQE